MKRLQRSNWIFALAVLAAMAGWNSSQQAAWAQVAQPDPGRTKSSESLRRIFDTVVAAADKATVVIEADKGENEKGQVALGTVVKADGYILTKASEVVGRSALAVEISGKSLPAKVVGVSERDDLAMLKVEAKDLAVVPWADLKKDTVTVGEWVASANAGGAKEEPFAVGVVSVGRRKIAGRNGFLGVQLGDSDGDGAKIVQVITDSAAEKAGVKEGDLITAVDGKPTKTREALIEAVHTFSPGEMVRLTVKRGDHTLELHASLGANAGGDASRYNMMNLMGGPVSKRASDFPEVYQHDTVIRPVDCGGPLVDLSGRVIGINIARAGRTETYALPADIILPLLEPLENGKLAPVNANASGPIKPGEKPTTLPERGE